jgi:hypothetical protein
VERSSWREVAVELTEDAAWVRRVATEITDRIHREIPRLGTDTELAEATRESVADNVWLFVSMVVAEVAPERAAPRTLAPEYVRLLVRRGVGAEVVAATYRMATQAFWRPWTELLRARMPEDRLAAALDESTQYILAFSTRCRIESSSCMRRSARRGCAAPTRSAPTRSERCWTAVRSTRSARRGGWGTRWGGCIAAYSPGPTRPMEKSWPASSARLRRA